MKKVNILVSSYNGEKYIEEQIDSLLNQTYKNINIYIRDDGSKDNTLNVLEKYSKIKNIKIIKGANVGFIKSFFELLKESSEADYYSFCDQDDIWVSNKIELAVNRIEEEYEKDKPILYTSDYDFYDENMKFSEHSNYYGIEKKPSFEKSLIECISPGMTMVFNKQLKDIVLKNIPNNCCYHDWWLYQVCSAFGKVIYDNHITVKYRRHSKNVSDKSVGIIKNIISVLKNKSFSSIWKKLKKQLIEFEEIYENELNLSQKKILKLFTCKKFNFSCFFKKLFFKGRFKDLFKEEIMIRLMFLIGRI